MKITNRQSGFTAIELLITLFIAAAFLMSGYQLYGLIIKDGGQTRANGRAGNVAYDYLQRYKPYATNPCTAQTPLTNSAITVANLSNVTVTVAISCPYGTASSVSKILVTLNYNSPQQVVSNATYVVSPGIVTNGLVLNLDAGNLASYPGSGTTWFDLSGNGNNGTLVNGPAYNSANGGSISFTSPATSTSTNTYNYVSLGSDKLKYQDNFTIEVWGKFLNNPTNAGSGCAARHPLVVNNTYGYNIWIAANGKAEVSIYHTVGTASGVPSADLLTGSNYFQVAFTKSGTTVNVYKNGSLNNTGVLSSSVIYYTSRVFAIGGQYDCGPDFFYANGNISIVRAYDHVLTSTEITQNFNTLRGRYGI